MFGNNPFNEYRATLSEGLKGDQHKLDHDKDGDIDGKDFAALRGKKKKSKDKDENATMNPKVDDKTAKATAVEAKEDTEVNEMLGALSKKKVTPAMKDRAEKMQDEKPKGKKEEGYYKDKQIKAQDKAMGAKPVPAPKKESKIRESLLAVLEDKKHTKGAEKAEDPVRGNSNKKMMDAHGKPTDAGFDDEEGHDDAAKAGRAGPKAKARNGGDATNHGDKKVINKVKEAYASMYAKKDEVEEDIQEAEQLDELSPEKLHKAADQQSKRTTRIGALASKMAAAGRNSDKADKMYDKSKARQDRLRKGANAAGDRDAEKAYQASKRK